MTLEQAIETVVLLNKRKKEITRDYNTALTQLIRLMRKEIEP